MNKKPTEIEAETMKIRPRKKQGIRYNRISLKSSQFGKMIQALADFKQAVKEGKPAIIIGPDYVVIDKNTYNEKFR